MKTTEIISKEVNKYITNANVGQEEYFLLDSAHKVVSVKVNGRKVDFEVVLRIKAPKMAGDLEISIEDKIRK